MIQTDCPTRATVAAALQVALAALLAAEATVLETTLQVHTARRALENAEDYALLNTTALDGRNAEVRAAQLRSITTLQRNNLADCEDGHRRAVSALEGARATFSAWKATARLVAGE